MPNLFLFYFEKEENSQKTSAFGVNCPENK
jgi:hypothetical protein